MIKTNTLIIIKVAFIMLNIYPSKSEKSKNKYDILALSSESNTKEIAKKR